MNWIDTVVGYINPKAGLMRAKNRVALEAMRKYDAASTGRRTSGWYATGSSANAETAESLNKLRDRARELVRNNPYAKNAIDVIVTNTIGTGIVPRPRKNAEILLENWHRWASTKKCDYENQHTFYGLQALAMRTIAESGEVIIRKRMVNDKTNPLRLQILEPDFIDSTKNFPENSGGGYTIQGIEFDKSGKRVAYWLWSRHPGDSTTSSLKSERVEADGILHVYSVDRPGQVRGVPFGASAMLRLRDFDDYEDAQLMRQKIAACFSVFVQDASADAIGGSNSSDELPERVEPGIIEKLPAGKTVTFASPPAAEGYGEYTRKVLQAIAIGYGVTYEALTSDLSNVNFSSGRMGWLEFHRRIVHWQNNIIIPRICDEVWLWFITASRITGGATEDVLVDWTPPRREMIDPEKETNAIILAIRSGLTSWQEAVREQGYDPDTILNQIESDNKNFDEKGIILDIDPRVEASQAAAKSNQQSQQSQDSSSQNTQS